MNTRQTCMRGGLGLVLAMAASLAWAGQPVPRDAPKDATRSEQQADEETRQTARRMEATPAERRAELRALMRTADRRAQERIEALERDLARARVQVNAQSRERAQRALDRARRERERFRKEMARFDTNSAAAWIDLRAGIVAAYRDLAYAVSTARKEFRQTGVSAPADTRRQTEREESRK